MAEIEPLSPSELAAALGILLAEPGQGGPADPVHVRSFLDYIQDTAIAREGWQVRGARGPLGLFLALLLPGRIALALVPTPGELGIDAAAQCDVSAAAVAWLRRQRLHYTQALLLPAARAQAAHLQEVGFRPLAPLAYLERDAMYPWVEPPDVPESAWTNFGAAAAGDFAATVLETYEGSQDCPELTGLRPIEDILAAHQACGQFEPRWWELLRREGRWAGCLLLSRLRRASAAEVVYMGVVPSFRGRGVGALLLARALQHVREARLQRLMLVVDDRNSFAKRLYERFALRPAARRVAYYLTWPRDAAATNGAAF